MAEIESLPSWATLSLLEVGFEAFPVFCPHLQGGAGLRSIRRNR